MRSYNVLKCPYRWLNVVSLPQDQVPQAGGQEYPVLVQEQTSQVQEIEQLALETLYQQREEQAVAKCWQRVYSTVALNKK